MVDTNVATTANRANPAASAGCVASCARALQTVMTSGQVFIDTGNRIVAEYRRHLRARGEPGPGDAFFKWLLTNEWNIERVIRVTITPLAEDDEDFTELPDDLQQRIELDPSDRKFLAVAAAHPASPVVLQALDSKWWGWQEELAAVGIELKFLCPREIEAKHAEKQKPKKKRL